MKKIKGITVTLIRKQQTGTDPFGAPIYTDVEVPVDNVLVAPTASDDVVNQLNLTGRKAVYTLAIPKGDTNVWENQEVRFFGQRWRVFGIPLEGIEEMIPLDWNKKVMVERYE
ncbi:MAG: hypothetical protein GX900_06505 [Clostridiaceae bacterium]|jgi:hypothetical protein|nr:hypothetical protein [Clostridiaceae bacterium]